MNNRVTVVFFKTAYDTLGGGSQMLLRLFDGLDKSKYELILLTQTRDVVAEQAEELGVSIQIVPYRGALDTYDGELLSGSLLKKTAAAFRMLQFNTGARFVLAKADILWIDEVRSYTTLLPYILIQNPTTIWNIGLLQESSGIVSILHELALHTTDCVFIESKTQANNKFTDRQFKKYQNKFELFHKGINVDKFSPCPNNSNNDDVTKIGTAALIHPRKNIDILIDSFAKVDKENVELHIAGEPAREGNQTYLNELQNKISEYQLEDSITFHGWVDDMVSFYDSVDIFVLPSKNEGIPGAVREALAMEIPVIATDVGGTSEVVINGETGYLAESANDDEISNLILQLLNDESERRKLGKQGRKHIINNFSIDSYVNNYVKLFNRLTQ